MNLEKVQVLFVHIATWSRPGNKINFGQTQGQF